MTSDDRTARLLEQLRTRRSLVEVSRETFLRAVQDSEDPEEIIEAAQGSLRAEGELRAIDVATRSLIALAESPGSSDGERRRDRLRAADSVEPGAVRQQIAELVALLLSARTHALAADALRTFVKAAPSALRAHVEALTIASVAQLAVHAAVVAPAAAVSGLLGRFRVLVETLRGLGFASPELDEVEASLHPHCTHPSATPGIPRLDDTTLPVHGSANSTHGDAMNADARSAVASRHTTRRTP